MQVRRLLAGLTYYQYGSGRAVVTLYSCYHAVACHAHAHVAKTCLSPRPFYFSPRVFPRRAKEKKKKVSNNILGIKAPK